MESNMLDCSAKLIARSLWWTPISRQCPNARILNEHGKSDKAWALCWMSLRTPICHTSIHSQGALLNSNVWWRHCTVVCSRGLIRYTQRLESHIQIKPLCMSQKALFLNCNMARPHLWLYLLLFYHTWSLLPGSLFFQCITHMLASILFTVCFPQQTRERTRVCRFDTVFCTFKDTSL